MKIYKKNITNRLQLKLCQIMKIEKFICYLNLKFYLTEGEDNKMIFMTFSIVH